MTLSIKPEVYRDMWNRVRSLQRENDELRRKLKAVDQAGERQKMDHQQREAQKREWLEILQGPRGND